ncbi:MAG: O-antigen ligase family protein [Terrimicrobiaceae bacterium]
MNIRWIPLLEVARWALLGLLVYAPWAYGATRPWAKISLAWALLALLPVFVAGLLQRHRWPRVPVPVLAVTLLLLAQGWGMAWNAWEKFDGATFTFAPVEQWLPGWPGAVDGEWCSQAMLAVSGLAVALWIVCDLAAHPAWRSRLLWTIAIAGASIAVLGLVQRMTGAHEIFWGNANVAGGTFFATYRYHANAGAFLNLVLPFVAVAVAWTFRGTGSSLRRAFWPMALLLVGAAAFVNISRAAMAITLVLLVILAIWFFLETTKTRHIHRLVRWGLPTVVLGLVFLSSWAFGLQATFEKWSSGESFEANSRLVVYGAIRSEMLPAIGNFGFGPGTFQITFPFYSTGVAEKIPGIWRYAHQDYLQALVEWGWIGGALWAGLFLGGGLLGTWRLVRRGSRMGFEESSLLFASLLSLGGILLHAMGDFPLQIASLRLYAVCALGLCWSLGKPGRTERRTLSDAGYPPQSRETQPCGSPGSALVAVPIACGLALVGCCAAPQNESLRAVERHLQSKQQRALALHANELQERREAREEQAMLKAMEQAALPDFRDAPDVVPTVPPKSPPPRGGSAPGTL